MPQTKFEALIDNIYAERVYLAIIKPYLIREGGITLTNLSASESAGMVTGTLSLVAPNSSFFTNFNVRDILYIDNIEMNGSYFSMSVNIIKKDYQTNYINCQFAMTDSQNSITGMITYLNNYWVGQQKPIRFRGQVTRYLSTNGFIDEFNNYYEPRIDKALDFSSEMYSESTLGGQSVPGQGKLTLTNNDGQYDDLRFWGWSGRPVKILLGGDDFTSIDDFGTIFAGVTDDIQITDSEATINLTDYQAILKQPIYTEKYSGVGYSSTLVEGQPEQEGKTKPSLFGRAFNMTPVSLGLMHGYQAYQFHHSYDISKIVADYDPEYTKVYSQGLVIPFNGYFDLSTGKTDTGIAPVPGTWYLNRDFGLIIVGSNTASDITTTITGDIYCTLNPEDPVTLTKSSAAINSLVIGTDITFTASDTALLYEGQYLNLKRDPSLDLDWVILRIKDISGSAITATIINRADSPASTSTFTVTNLYISRPDLVVKRIIDDLLLGEPELSFSTINFTGLDYGESFTFTVPITYFLDVGMAVLLTKDLPVTDERSADYLIGTVTATTFEDVTPLDLVYNVTATVHKRVGLSSHNKFTVSTLGLALWKEGENIQFNSNIDVGIYITDQKTPAIEVLDTLLKGTMTFYGFNRVGQFFLKQFYEPSLITSSTDPLVIMSIDGDEVESLSKEASSLPVYKIEFKYNKNYTTADNNSLVPAVRDNSIYGIFETDTQWIKDNVRWVINTTTTSLNLIATTGNNIAYTSFLCASGTKYRIELDVDSFSGGGTIDVYVNTVSNLTNAVLVTSVSSAGKVSVEFTPTTSDGKSGTLYFLLNASSAATSSVIPNITMKPSHYFQLIEEYNTVNIVSQEIRALYGQVSAPLTQDTCIFDFSSSRQSVKDLSYLLFGLYSKSRDTFSVKAKLQPLRLNIGDIVWLSDPYRWSIEEGKALLVIKLDEDAYDNVTSVTLWG